MTVRDAVASLGIERIVHFTTNNGLVGTLHSRALKSRHRLRDDQNLEFIFEPNAHTRKDVAWLDYVNLSIERANDWFFRISSDRWHQGEDKWWCILSFDSAAMADDGVVFATTNNMYTGVRRAPGEPGLRALYDDRIVQWTGQNVSRPAGLAPRLPTCAQAEVLYPGELSIEYLRTIWVASDLHGDTATAQLEVFGVDGIDVQVDPGFTSITR